jgi:hypothetical protein
MGVPPSVSFILIEQLHSLPNTPAIFFNLSVEALFPQNTVNIFTSIA